MPRKYRRRSLHHRRPRSGGGGENSDNLVWCPQNKHRSWHVLFQNWSPQRIAEEINRNWLDTRFKFIVVARQHNADPGGLY